MLIGTLLFFGACNVTRNIEDGEYLLAKNKIEIDTSSFQ